MVIVRTAPRAFVTAMLPLAFLHLAVLVMAVVATLAPDPVSTFGAPAPNRLPPELPAPDRLLVAFLIRICLDAGLFVAAHHRARQLGVSSRLGYALLGGGAALISYAVASATGLNPATLPTGAVMTAGLVPGFVGMITGFLYWQLAGLEPVAGPATMETAAGRPTAPPRYGGPIQVRTSLGAMGIAATTPALAVFCLALPLILSGMPLLGGPDGGAESWTPWVLAAAMPVQMMLVALLMSAIPAALFALAVHGLARALKRTRPLDYVGCGAIGGLAVAVVLAPINPFTMLGFLAVPMIVVGAAIGGVYRRCAGVEPLPLPELVLVRDIEAVVPENHPDRTTRQIVLD